MVKYILDPIILRTGINNNDFVCFFLELNICKSFGTGRYDSFGELLAENKRDLQMLQSLVNY